MNSNVKSSEKIALAAVVSPQTVANTEQFTGVVDLGAYQQALGIAMLGNMAAETINFTAYRCDSAGNNAVSLKAATQLSASATANDGKQIMINVTADELMAVGAQYIKFGLVTGDVAGGPAAVIALGVDGRTGPVSQPATVLEVKA